jgi:hypothetical protein
VHEFPTGSLFLSLFLCCRISLSLLSDLFLAGFRWLPNLCDVARAV